MEVEQVQQFFKIISNNVTQGLAQYQSYGASQKRAILDNLPSELQDGYLRLLNPIGVELPERVPTYLHILGNSPVLQQSNQLEIDISSHRLDEHMWLLKSENCSHIEKCRFRWFKLFQADDFLQQLRDFDNTKLLSERYLYFIDALPNVSEMVISGDTDDDIPSFSDLVHQFVEQLEDDDFEDEEYSPSDVFTHQFITRAKLSLDGSKFPNLRRLTIKDNLRLVSISVASSSVEEVVIQNVSNVERLNISAPIRKLIIEERSLRRFSINLEQLVELKTSGVKGGLSEAVHLTEPLAIRQHFEKLKQDSLYLRDLGRVYHDWLPDDTKDYDKIYSLFVGDGDCETSAFGWQVDMNEYLFSKELLFRALSNVVQGLELPELWNEDELWTGLIQECGEDSERFDMYGGSISSLLTGRGGEVCSTNEYVFKYPVDTSHSTEVLAQLAPFVETLTRTAGILCFVNHQFLSGFLSCFSTDEIDRILKLRDNQPS